MALHKSLTTITPLSKFLAMALFIVFPFLGFYLGTQYQELIDFQNIQTVNTNSSAINHPVPSQTLFANWKTYKTAQGFEFKYPEIGYEVLVESESDHAKKYKSGIPSSFTNLMGYNPPPVISALRVTQIIPTDVISANDSVFSVWIFDNSSNIDIDQWYKKYWYYPFNFGQAVPSVIEANTPKNQITVDGIQGKYTIQDSIGKVQYIYIPRDNKILLISVLGDLNEQTVGNQILSTFRFLE